MNRNSIALAAGLVGIVLLAGCAEGDFGNQETAQASVPATEKSRLSSLRLPAGTSAITRTSANKRLDARLRGRTGPVDVWVTLDQESLAANKASVAAAAGLESMSKMSAASASATMKGAIADHRSKVLVQQATAAESLAGLGAEELGRVNVAHNAIAIRIDASQLQQVAAVPGVARVRPVLNYELDLSETVPYVGAAAVQASGVDGTGITVAVLDSGVDYTHFNLGGAGTLEAYAAAYGASTADPLNRTRDGLFPTDKVVDGFDFVGETWGVVNGVVVGTRTEDPDPIDFDGHGTHVSDIIAGESLDGAHKGVAPGASLVSVKVCSAITTACNGVALLLGMDFALDPNGDGDTDDAVDVINMSLGSPYGQLEDDLSLASTNAVNFGVVVVTSAGNSANLPYVVGSPSIAPGVISIAQTQVPSATAVPLVINSPAVLAGTYSNTQTVDWAPIGNGATGDVAFIGRGCPAGSIVPGSPEDAYLASPAGKVALIDRGACSVSLKVDRAAKAGAIAVLIGLVAPGDAVSFSFGGGDTFVPTLVIQQSLSTAIKTQLAAAQTVNVTLSNAAAIPLVGSMASTSSRGPAIATQLIKPEIGAPGASLSAEVGTGTGETAFGGTSGAAPMVSGAVALMLEAHPNRSVAQLKAMLMNGAETTVYTNPALVPGELAPITRIGAGELRVDRAIKLSSAAWQVQDKSAALSFGALEVSSTRVVTKRVRVQNFGKQARTFTITPTFRYANDEASGAVAVSAPDSVHVGPNRATQFTVQLTIDPSKLPAWVLNGGSQGGNGAALNLPEYDGYITLTDGSEKLSLPWHVLPRKAAETSLRAVRQQGQQILQLSNAGADDGEYDFFSLTGKSPRQPNANLPQPGDNFATIDLHQVGVRHLPAAIFGADYLEFAINTFGRRSHPNYPAEFDIDIDTNGDGKVDYVVFNIENGGFAVSGQNVVVLFSVATGAATPVFFTDADLNSGNAIFTVPMNASAGPTNLGVNPGTTIEFSVYAFDNYFTGDLTDALEFMRFTPGNPRYSVPGVPFGAVAPSDTLMVPLQKANVPAAASSEIGALLMYRRNAVREAQSIVRGQ